MQNERGRNINAYQNVSIKQLGERSIVLFVLIPTHTSSYIYTPIQIFTYTRPYTRTWTYTYIYTHVKTHTKTHTKTCTENHT